MTTAGAQTDPVTLAFGTTTGNAGFGTVTAYTTVGGKFLMYADEVNGLYCYTEGTATWAKVASGTGAGQISGIDPANIAFVTSWKNRIWFVERNSTRAWYLPIGQIAGVAASIDFGNRFKYGGQLVGVWSWTVDGGSGVDDYLVGISTAGDVLVYAGSDPTVDFTVRGSWFIGKVPSGRRIATDVGGDLLLLTAQGILP
ncbi:MAG TPA: hypothetical protein DCP69_10590, partial [Candidatus Omnitrophica bacterium]|nr:hypothetical protein [Candidatus Omnitrophota bacterium]